MKNCVLLILIILILGCHRGEDTPTGNDGTPANETFWQLVDDSELTVQLTPWPPQSTTSTLLKVEAGPGDWSESSILVQQVLFAVTTTPDRPASWNTLRLVKSDPEDSKFYEGEVKLPSGKVYLHFEAKGSRFDGGVAGELQPWELNVK